MNNDNWKEAIELLLPMANSADSKISKKASHTYPLHIKPLETTQLTNTGKRNKLFLISLFN